MKIGDISFFAVLTSRKSFDDYNLAINVGAGTGKIKYDPHHNNFENENATKDDETSGTGIFLGFNLNTPYLSNNGGTIGFYYE